MAALAPATAQAPAELRVEDPAGDTSEGDSGDAQQTARGAACPVAGPSCWSAPWVPVWTPGAPAGDGFDLLGFTLQETASTVEVAVQVARLGPGFEGAVDPEAGRGAAFGVCWRLEDTPCGERVVVSVSPTSDGVDVSSSFSRNSESCNTWQFCAWSVPVALEAGAPATLRWSIPRALLADGSQGATLETAGAFSSRTTGIDPQGYYAVGGAAYGYVGSDPSYTVDAAGWRDGLVLALPPVDAPLGRAPVVEDAQGGTGPETDILRFELVETQETLTLALQMARVSETPQGASEASASISLADGRVYSAGVVAEDGTRYPWAGTCADAKCESWINFPPRVDLAYGSPGWLNFTFSRGDLGAPAAGDLVRLTYAAAREGGAGHYADGGGFLPPSKASTSGDGDFAAFLPPYRLRHDTVLPPPPAGLFVEDDLYDAGVDGEPTLTFSTLRFDVTSLHVERVSPGTLRVVLAIHDLSTLSVPTGYRALFYGVGLRTAAGDFMAGYHRAEGGPTTPVSQDFLCASDTAVLKEAKEDPQNAQWTRIFGAISTAASNPEGDRGSRAGAVTLEVPVGCLGMGPSDADLLGVRAGAYLVDAAGNVRELDSVDGGPATLAPQSAEVARPWYANPFGVDNFWDMLGIAAAVGTSVTGVLVVRHRRGLLRRYLADVEDAAAQPGARRHAALLDVRARLKRDLVRGALAESHYVIVERRLDEHLARVRVDDLADAFGDLPARLLKRLEGMLVDGRMGAEDYRLFCTLLEDAPMRDEERERVRKKLAHWVEEDAGVATS